MDDERLTAALLAIRGFSSVGRYIVECLWRQGFVRQLDIDRRFEAKADLDALIDDEISDSDAAPDTDSN